MSGFQPIGLGLTPDDGLGDTPRVAGEKINRMLAELFDRDGGGGGGGSALISTAIGALSGHRVVKAVPGGVGYPSLAASADGDLILGITTAAAGDGMPIAVQTGDAISEPSWNWALGPVFAGDKGVLTQARPAGAWLRRVGTAVAPTRLLIDLRPTIQTL